MRESTGQPASRPVDRDVHNDPADRPSASGQCLQCFPLVASVVVVHRRYSRRYSHMHHSKARVRARGICAPVARSWASRGVEADSLPPGHRLWLRCSRVNSFLSPKETATILQLYRLSWYSRPHASLIHAVHAHAMHAPPPKVLRPTQTGASALCTRPAEKKSTSLGKHVWYSSRVGEYLLE